MNRRLLPLVAATLALSACLKPAPPPAAAPPEVVAGTANVSLARLPAATVASWLGSWRSGTETLGVARVGDALTVARSGGAVGQPLTLVGLGTFTDAAGTSYLFGPGAVLRTYDAAGSMRSWSR